MLLSRPRTPLLWAGDSCQDSQCGVATSFCVAGGYWVACLFGGGAGSGTMLSSLAHHPPFRPWALSSLATNLYTVSRASCIWQNENGSCEAGPYSKCWWNFISPMANGSFPNPLNWWRIRFGCTALDQCYRNKENWFANWRVGWPRAWSAAGEILLQLILYIHAGSTSPPPTPH